MTPSHLTRVPLFCALLALASLPAPARGQPPQGLGQPQGLGAAGGLLKTDPKAVAIESELLKLINDQRGKEKLAPLASNPRLQTLMRNEAALAAKGDPTSPQIHDRVKKGGYAPYGYMLAPVYGSAAPELFKRIGKDKNMVKAMTQEYATAGVGAVWVPAEPPYFQVIVIIAQEPDPMAGKTGLTKAETDPVMSAAMPGVKTCYDQALKRNPNLGGDMILKMVIGAGGAVTEAELNKSTTDIQLDACLVDLARGLKFPAPYKDKPVTLHHPFKLAPPQGSRRLGLLSDTQVGGVFSRALPSFQRCYDERLKARPGLSGKLTLALTVLPEGDTKNLRLQEDAINDVPLSTCILDLARELRFPKPKWEGEVDVTYPLSFSPPP